MSFGREVQRGKPLDAADRNLIGAKERSDRMKEVFDWLKKEFKERKSKCDKKSKEILGSEGYSGNYRLFEGKSIGFRIAIEQVENAEIKFSEKEKEIRSKAIEEFAEACKNHIFCQTFGLHPKTIDEIARELKGE